MLCSLTATVVEGNVEGKAAQLSCEGTSVCGTSQTFKDEYRERASRTVAKMIIAKVAIVILWQCGIP